MSVPKCTSWRGHKFEARHSITALATPPKLSDYQVESMSEYTFLELARLRTRSTYERDVCVRCGHVIQRSPEASQ